MRTIEVCVQRTTNLSFNVVKQIPLLRLIAPTLVRLLWFILRHSPSFLIMVCRPFPAFWVCWDDPLQPCIVPIVSLFCRILRKILPWQVSGYSHPCVWGLKTSLDSDAETSQSPSAPTSAVTFAAQSTSWARHRPFGWRSSKFSRIPDRLCGRGVDE